MATDDRDQPAMSEHTRRVLLMLADRLDPPPEPEAAGPPAPNSQPDEPCPGDVTP
jgi:hypothetical protein